MRGLRKLAQIKLVGITEKVYIGYFYVDVWVFVVRISWVEPYELPANMLP